MKSKGNILEDSFEKNVRRYVKLSFDETKGDNGYDWIFEAMDIYAKQMAAAFGNFIIDNSYTKSNGIWYKYFTKREDFPAGYSMLTPVYDFKTIDEIYALFIEQSKQK